MIILDNSFISDMFKHYLNKSQTPVLCIAPNERFVKEEANVVNKEEFAKLFEERGKFYVFAESSLAWITENIKSETLANNISNMKNKVNFRKFYQKINPDFFFQEVLPENLDNIDFDSLPKPFVLKPSVGFFSKGVYVIEKKEELKAAVQEIKTSMQDWVNEYSTEVINNDSFIIEDYIEGDEYAIDAYYDENGKAVILNLLRHDFPSSDAVTDRWYYTSKKIIKENIENLEKFLNDMNELFKAKNFAYHVEVRIKNGNICPIEFNPMRFAGLCSTEISHFAYGHLNYDYFLNNKKPDWDTILADAETDNKIYSVLFMEKPKLDKPINNFDYAEFAKVFKYKPVVRPMDFNKTSIFGYAFIESDGDDQEEFDFILRGSFEKFIS